MRTKHLLIALALPLGFAACSQEEIVSNENLNNTANRKTVENVTLNFESEAASRMIYQYPNYVWEAGDQYGACLMDIIPDMTNYLNSSLSWYSKFEIVDYIHTNYPFTKQVSGGWTSEAVMSEGNYFFYFPYNSNMGGKRSPIKLQMPTAVLERGDKAMSVFNDQLFVGYSKIVADPEKEHDVVNVTMEPVLAAAGFHMKNTGTTPVTVRKVAFVKDGGFPTYFEVKPAGFDNAWFYHADNTADGRRAQVQAVVKDGETKMDKVAVVYDGGRALGSQGELTTYIMMPEDLDMDKTALHIYTNLGVGIIDLTKTTEGTTSNYENDITLTSVKYGDVKTVNIEFDNATLTKLKTLAISTTDELEDLVAWNKDITDNTALEAELLPNANVTLTKKVVDMLNNNKKLTLYINSADAAVVTIPSNAPANAYDKVVWNKNVRILNNGQTSDFEEDGTTPIAQNTNVTVRNEATQTIESAKLLASINNYGAITFQAYNDKTLDINNMNITNRGTINFANTKADKTITLSNMLSRAIVNKGTINVNARLVANRTIDNEYGIMNINAYLNAPVENDAKESKYTSLVQGVINVNATWEAGYANNDGTINVNENGKLTTGVATNAAINSDNTVLYGPWPFTTHYSTVNVKGIVEGIENDGYVIIKNTTATYTPDTDDSEGYVNNNILNRYVVDSGDETIYITLEGDNTTSALKEAVETSNAEEVRIKGNLTINATKDDIHTGIAYYHYIKGNCADLNVVTTGNLNILGKGHVAFDGKTGNTTFTVSENTVTDIHSYANLSVFNDGTIDVKGTIKVQASASVVGQKDGTGTVVKAGTWNF